LAFFLAYAQPILKSCFWLQVLQEGTVKPLYHILGSTLTSQEETFSRTKTGLALVSGTNFFNNKSVRYFLSISFPR
jgi:hypothetical protein